MPRAKRKQITMLVTVTAPGNVGNGDARGVARLAIANGLELNRVHTQGVKLISVRPVPAVAKAAIANFKRSARIPARLPLIDYINQEKDQ